MNLNAPRSLLHLAMLFAAFTALAFPDFGALVSASGSRSPMSLRNAYPNRAILPRKTTSCVSPDPPDTLTARLNQLLQSGGPGFVLNLCPSTQYLINDTIKFSARNQEITTVGQPTDDTRAILVINGPRTADGTGHTVAVNGQCVDCSGCKLRHIQVNGTRSGHPSILGGANIEMGGPTAGQLVEFVKSYDPRSWSCLHASEGVLNCTSITIQNNDIGPCGVDAYDQWADGISVACTQSVVRSNMINTPTDGGIVIFGPEILVENNTIWVETHSLLGGINLVDINPWNGNYTGVIVQKNNVIGGFATETKVPGDSKGFNSAHAMIKVGIAMGPRVWFGPRAYRNVSVGALVRDNRLTGGFGFGMAANAISDFTIENNVLVGNTSFFGVQGPNCTKNEQPITPGAFVQIPANVTNSKIQSDFVAVTDADGLICIEPPDGDYWPFGNGRQPALGPIEVNPSAVSSRRAKIVVGITLGVVLAALSAYFARRWYLRRRYHLTNNNNSLEDLSRLRWKSDAF